MTNRRCAVGGPRHTGPRLSPHLPRTSMSSQTRFGSQSWTNDRAIYLALAGRFRGMKTPSCSRPRYPSRRPNLRRNPFPAYRQSARPTSRTNRRPKIPRKSRRHRSTSSSKARRRLFSLGNPGGFGRFRPRFLQKKPRRSGARSIELRRLIPARTGRSRGIRPR